MSEKRFEVDVDHLLLVWDTEKNKRLEIEDIVGLLNEQQVTIEHLKEENEQLKSLVNACEYGQKNLMKEMENSDEALDKIWEIMKELYGVVDDE